MTKSKVDELLERHPQQLSRRYRIVSCLPVDMTGLEALKERAPERLAKYLKDFEDSLEEWAADEYKRHVAVKFGDEYTLNVAEFHEYLSKTGRAPSSWTPTSEPCEHCQTLGHMHAKNCPNRRRATKAEAADV